MHIWHHAYEMPSDKPYGINFGLTLAIWDYIFGTAVIPHNGKDIRLGFPGDENFPKSFGQQALFGLKINSITSHINQIRLKKLSFYKFVLK